MMDISILKTYPIDMVGVMARATSFASRSIKASSKRNGLYLAVAMTDLTTLEGADTPEKVKQLCGKAMHPVPPEIMRALGPGARDIPHTAAICVYPELVSTAVKALRGSQVKVASVATSFPAGQASLEVKLHDVRMAIESGADEIDMVIDRGAFLSGRYQKVYDEICAVKELLNGAHLKVILETGELATHDNIRAASWLAMEAGADFIKTSTGKVSPAATMDSTLVMLEAIRDYHQATGRQVGMKPAGGIKNSKMALSYLVMLAEVLGEAWLTPEWFRFGASTLLNDLLKQIFKLETGHYYYDDVFSVD